MNGSHQAQATESSRCQLRVHGLCLTQFAQGCTQFLFALALPSHPLLDSSRLLGRVGRDGAWQMEIRGQEKGRDGNWIWSSRG